jgi:GNAT superfamily N-acetyltransferase
VESVRTATGDDRSRLLELSEELVTAVTSQRGGELLVEPTLGAPAGAELGERLVALLDRPDALVLLGALDEVVIGLAVSVVEEDRRGHRRGRLGGCFVEEGARGVGVGRLLLDRSLAWMSERGCTGVDGLALPGDRTAKSFYEAAGFKARVLTMHRPLE